MLRVGLTGNLGSGKSTVAARFAHLGATVFSSDAVGRELMQPRQAVFDQIVALFGHGVLRPDGLLDRPALARLAFAEGRVEELNAIVHPAVIAQQAALAEELFAANPDAILIVESALIFETNDTVTRDGSTRFDRILLVTAPDADKIARFIQRQSPDAVPTPAERQALEAEARRRLALQIPDRLKAPRSDHVLTNDGSLQHLEAQVDALWPILRTAAERHLQLRGFSSKSLQ